jgi:hypothetical protein
VLTESCPHTNRGASLHYGNAVKSISGKKPHL